jgi:hypothetical protein
MSLIKGRCGASLFTQPRSGDHLTNRLGTGLSRTSQSTVMAK